MNEAIFSGVLAKMYEQVCEFFGETYHEIKTEVENSYHRYDESYKDRHGQLKSSVLGCGNLYRLTRSTWRFSS